MKSKASIGNNHGKNVKMGWGGLVARLGGFRVAELSESVVSGSGLPETHKVEDSETCISIHETDFMLPAVASDPPAVLALPSPAEAAAIAPEDLQPVFARELQRLIAAGLPEIEAPRTLKELASAVSMWRSLAKLDKVESAGPAVLVAPMRSVQRRRVGPVVDVGKGGDMGQSGAH